MLKTVLVTRVYDGFNISNFDMMKNKITYLLAVSFCVLFSLGLKAQQGKDGAGNIAGANTVVNIYTPLTASVAANSTNVITVGSAAGFSAGDLIYVIQMQGATVKAYTYWFGDSLYALPADTGSGKIKAYGSTGNNEFAQVKSVSGNNITLDCQLKNSYGDSVGGVPKVQVIRVPRYSSLTVTGSITAQAWNGSTGGVVVVEVQGATTITGSIDVSSKGFRGGTVKDPANFAFTSTDVGYGYQDNSAHKNHGAYKGESIVGDTTVYRRKCNGNYDWGNAFWLSNPMSNCKGNVANGGGGGNANNCGGGGGSNAGDTTLWNGMGNPDNSTANNISAWSRESTTPTTGSFRPTSSSGGGRGGYAFSNNNADPTLAGNGPNSSGVWAGDGRHNDGGWGGTPLNYTRSRVYLGGGGGAGDSNDGNGTSGANGGGIVYLLTYGNITGAGQIIADGGTAANTNLASGATKHGDDGAGGGGGGGAVVINSSGSITLTNATPISAKGGAGGNFIARAGITLNANFGPGGGGGGGYIATTSAVAGTTVAGGANGIVVSNGFNATKIATKFPPNGATSGGAGSSATATNFYLTATNYTICAGSSASLSVTANGTGIPSPISYNWYNASVGGASIFTGNPYNTGALAVGTYTYYAGTCPGTYRIPVVVTVLNAPTLTVTPTATTICGGGSATFTASGASSYTWSPSTGLSATSGSVVTANPAATATYTVVGANGTCTDTKTFTVTIAPTPTVSIAPSATAICSGTAVTFTASGAPSFTWSANAGSATTATATASPTVTTTYSVTGSNGTCSSTQTVSINVTTTPTTAIAASSIAICSGTPVTFTASGATNYTWSANVGSVTTATATASPTTTTVYSVTGANGNCTSAQTITVTVTSTPTVTAIASATTICSGTAVTFTASGATNYTWSANAGSVTTATATASPVASATYTVNGDNGGCPGTFTLAVNVITTPTVTAVASPTTICSSGSSTLTASGAATFTWSANANSATTATTSITPGATDTYTVIGDNGGGCTATQTVTVNVVTTPTVVITPSPAPICNGSTVTLSASGATTFTWSANAGSVTTATANVSPSVNTTYTVTGDNGGGCVSTQTVDVTITPTPNLNAVASNTAICNGTAITFTATGATSYTWSANAGGVNTATATATPTVTSTYTVTGDSLGCPTSKTVTVIVNNPPTQADSAVVSAACGQSNGSYQVNSVTGGTGPYQINFNNTGFTTISSFTYTVPNLAAGSYPVVIQDNAGCTYSTSVIINNTGGITSVDSSITNAACNPSNSGAIALNSVTGGTGPYQVSVNGGGFNPIASFPYNIPGLTAGTYTITVKDASGCIHITQITVAPPAGGITNVGLTSQNAMCVPPNSGSIIVNTVTGGTGPYQVAINGGPYNSMGSLPYTISSGFSAGTYTINVQDALGCTNSTTVAVNGSSGPTNAIVSTVKDTCGKNVGTLTITNVVGGTPTYSYNINGGTNQTANTFTALATGYYTVTVTDANGCMFVHYDSVRNVLPPPVPVITGPSAVCQGGSATLTSSSATGNLWSTTATTQTISVNTSGTYTVSVTQYGCVSTSAPFTFTVNPNPTLVVSPSTTICTGTSATLTASGGTSYTWSPATGLSSTSNGTVTANPSGPTTYTVITTDVNNCSATSTIDIAVGTTPGQPGIPDSNLVYCLYQAGIPTLTATANGGATLNWYDSNMNPIIPGPPKPDSSKLAPQIFYVTQSIGSCVSPGRDSIRVDVMAPPTAAFSTDPSSGNILANQGVTLIPVQAANPSLMYSWNFGDPNSGANDVSGLYSPTHTFDDAGTYCVTFDIMSMVSGCESQATNCIEVLPGINITIPNVFTPNGDGINEVFTIKSTGFSDLSCNIFDRWGLKLYSWTGIAGSWDGTDSKNGKAVTDGTYYYIIEATDVKKDKHKYEGYIQLIR